jgi:acyl-CoA thioesterase
MQLNSLIVSYIAQNNFGRLLGMQFEIEEPGKVIYTLQTNADHLATPLAVHGGCTAALLDATMGVGALSLVCDKNKVVATLEMKASFLKSIFVNEQLTAESIVVKKGRSLIFMEAEVYNQKKQLVAKSSGTFTVMDAEKSGYQLN